MEEEVIELLSKYFELKAINTHTYIYRRKERKCFACISKCNSLESLQSPPYNIVNAPFSDLIELCNYDKFGIKFVAK